MQLSCWQSGAGRVSRSTYEIGKGSEHLFENCLEYTMAKHERLEDKNNLFVYFFKNRKIDLDLR